MGVPAYIGRQHRRLRRPIRLDEVPHLARLGRELRSLREAARLSRPELAALSSTSVETIKTIELTKARTRQSTLDRLTQALAAAQPQLGVAEVLLARLVAAAGPALAPESKYSARVESRRRRRARKGHYLPRGSRRNMLTLVIERPQGGESAKSFLARMERRENGEYVCLHCGRAAIGLEP
jgi:transcriptional regulator with XRE-family HTH domain